MKMMENAFLKAIKSGEKQVGLWVSLCSNLSAELVAISGYDWLLIDMEHAPNSEMSVLGQLQAIAPYTTAIVRPPWNDTVTVKRLMDIGSPGLLFPMVQSVAEAEAAVAAMRYPKDGVRGVAGSMRATKFGRITDYAARVADETAVIIQLETVEAMEQAVEIGTVDGVDGVFFGPADISADMGMMGQTMAPEVWDKIWVAARKLIDAGVPVGTLVLDPAFAAKLMKDGFTFVACGLDTSILARGSDALLADMRDRLKKD